MPVAPQPPRAEAASALNCVCSMQTSHTSSVPSALHPLRAICCLSCPPERPGTREAGPPSVAIVSKPRGRGSQPRCTAGLCERGANPGSWDRSALSVPSQLYSRGKGPQHAGSPSWAASCGVVQPWLLLAVCCRHGVLCSESTVIM